MVTTQDIQTQYPQLYGYLQEATAKWTNTAAKQEMMQTIINQMNPELQDNPQGALSFAQLNSMVPGADPNVNWASGSPGSLLSNYEKANPQLFQGDQTGLISSLKMFATEGIMSTPIAQIAMSIMTSGLAYEVQLAISAAMTIARGGNVQDVIKSAVGSLAANELSGFVKGLENITDPTVKTALANSVSMATKALATGGDVGQALIAGAAGGAIAAETQSATDSNAIARAAGEYAKALAAGQSQQQALTGALSGFISKQDKATAAPLIQAEAAKINPPSSADVVTTPYEPSGPPISSEQVSPLLPAEEPVTSSIKPTTLPEITVTDEPITSETPAKSKDAQIMDLTGITSTSPVAPAAGKKDTIMLSGLGAGTPAAGAPAASVAPAPTGGQAPPGSQALAQALRTGDVGDPLFGRKGKSNRPVWNIESLRTKDETGA